jgi:hypothetical protein
MRQEPGKEDKMNSTDHKRRNDFAQKFTLLPNIILSFCLLLSLSMLIYGLSMIGGEQDGSWVLTKWAYKIIFLSIIITVFLIAVFFLKREWKINIALFLFSIGSTLFFVNIYLIISDDSPDIMNAYERAAYHAKVNFDKRTKLEVVRDLREKGLMAYPAFPASSHTKEDFLPLGGISNKTTVYCNESGEYLIYTSDRFGFNNDDDAYEKDLDFLIVGDSYAQGACVQPGEDIAGVLRRNGYNSLTLGNGGNGPLIKLSSLIEYGNHLKPSYVLWVYYWPHMINRIGNEKKSKILIKYLNEAGFSQDLINRQTEIDNYLESYIDNVYEEKLKEELVNKTRDDKIRSEGYIKKIVSLYKIRVLLGFHRGKYLEKLEKLRKTEISLNKQLMTKEDNYEIFKKVMRKAQNVTSGFGGKICFINLPDMAYLSEHSKHRSIALYDKELFPVLEELGIPIINFAESAIKLDNPASLEPFGIHGHLTAEGYKLLVDQIINEYKKKYKSL